MAIRYRKNTAGELVPDKNGTLDANGNELPLLGKPRSQADISGEEGGALPSQQQSDPNKEINDLIDEQKQRAQEAQGAEDLDRKVAIANEYEAARRLRGRHGVEARNALREERRRLHGEPPGLGGPPGVTGGKHISEGAGELMGNKYTGGQTQINNAMGDGYAEMTPSQRRAVLQAKADEKRGMSREMADRHRDISDGIVTAQMGDGRKRIETPYGGGFSRPGDGTPRTPLIADETGDRTKEFHTPPAQVADDPRPFGNSLSDTTSPYHNVNKPPKEDFGLDEPIKLPFGANTANTANTEPGADFGSGEPKNFSLGDNIANSNQEGILSKPNLTPVPQVADATPSPPGNAAAPDAAPPLFGEPSHRPPIDLTDGKPFAAAAPLPGELPKDQGARGNPSIPGGSIARVGDTAIDKKRLKLASMVA